ncbi:hypothetical protein [Bradyrhizobium sp. Cp5.3]|uniref:hypothetical protein n=1 Tax=Bradyrhizobium sp. Cp5.3 TaxID=443598 RepID=UPI0012EC0FE0|nr:hypothetical protein [Bradyrhizobium sp. Cp5.3]
MASTATLPSTFPPAISNTSALKWPTTIAAPALDGICDELHADLRGVGNLLDADNTMHALLQEVAAAQNQNSKSRTTLGVGENLGFEKLLSGLWIGSAYSAHGYTCDIGPQCDNDVCGSPDID